MTLALALAITLSTTEYSYAVDNACPVIVGDAA